MPRWPVDATLLLLAESAVKATILLGLAVVVSACLRRSSAAIRHRLWALTLLAIAIVPPLSGLLPGWRPAILPASARDRLYDRERDLNFDRDRTGREGSTSISPSTESASRPEGGPGLAKGGSKADRDSTRFPMVALVWGLGAVAAAMPTIAGLVGNEWRRRGSRRVADPAWIGLLDETARRFGLRCRIELRMSPRPLIPMTWGTLRPVVFLPGRAEGWPESVRRLVLMHEVAHIARRDVAFQILGRLAASACWFHPLAWHALRRMRIECEYACDDLVVRLGTRRSDYAGQLVELARSLRIPAMAAALSMTRSTTLERRIMAIFDEQTGHEPLGRRPARILLAAAVASMIGLAAIRPGRSAAETPETATAVSKKAAPEDHTHPISISGRALDTLGKPIAGARIYVASMLADYKRIAETSTNAEGRYELRDAPLPIEEADEANPGSRDTGSFQVFGEADGFGFAWRPQKWFFPRPKPGNITYEPERRDPPSRFEADEKIGLDLRFSPSERLSGTIVDDLGIPLKGVRLEVRNCEALAIVDDIVPGWTLDALNEPNSAPPSMKLRTTDASGRFEFAGLPENCRFWMAVRAENFPQHWFFAATTRGPQPAHGGSPVFTGEIKLTLTRPHEVPIRLLTLDTDLPASKALISAGRGSVSASKTTDELGGATLMLPAGKYGMQYLPAKGTPYLVTEDEIVVGPETPAEPIVVRLRAAAVVEVTVVDEATDAGIPDVDLWEQANPNGPRELVYFRSWEVATRIAHVDRPRTDSSGFLRALVEPGKHRLGVGLEAIPRGFVAVDREGREIEAVAGETVRLKFALRKRR